MPEEHMENNRVYMAGKIVSGFRYSHEVYRERFYMADILVCRSSGATDTIPLMISERLLDVDKDYSGCTVRVSGQFRSYNRQDGHRNRLVLSVFVRSMEVLDGLPEPGDDTNSVILDGYVCKEPVCRRTPLGRDITDLLLAVNRVYGRSDYIPCICWRKDAEMAAMSGVGSRVRISGRIQSREYVKVHSETESETMVAYEVSVCSLEIKTEGKEAGT